MRNKPKFKIGDKVSIELEGKKYYGEVYVVDKNGTFKTPGIISYDIFIPKLNTLYKHILENEI